MKAEIIEQFRDGEFALYATEDKSLILIATKVGAYLHGTVYFHHKKSIKLDIIAKSGLHLISLFPAIK